MRVLLLLLCLIPISGRAQEDCKKAMGFFARPLLYPEAKPTTGALKFEAIRPDDLDKKDAKALNKMVGAVRKRAGAYAQQTMYGKFIRIMQSEEVIGYRGSFDLKVDDHYTYRFIATFSGSGKLEDVPLPKKISGQITNSCGAYAQGKAHPEIHAPVGLRLAMQDGHLVWEVWNESDKEVKLNHEKRHDPGMKRYVHKVLPIDALTGENMDTQELKHTRIK